MNRRSGPDAGSNLGLYLHVPFCASRCGYCDFNTYTATELGDSVRRDSFHEVLAAEVRFAAAALGDDRRAVDTVFVGGGTPTLLGSAALVSLLDAVQVRVRTRTRRRGHDRGEPRQRRRGHARRASRGRLHPHLVRDAEHLDVRAPRPRPHAHSRREPRGCASGRTSGLRAREPRPHLRHARGVGRRPAAICRGGDRCGRGPRVRLLADRRGRDPAGAARAPRGAAGPRRRHRGRALRDRRPTAHGRRHGLVRGLELGASGRGVPAQPRLLERRRLVGYRSGGAQPPWWRAVVERQAPAHVRRPARRRAVAGGGP